MLRGLAQRFFNQLILASKVPAAVDIVRQAIAQDMNVVTLASSAHYTI
jgi:hypothetical protein